MLLFAWACQRTTEQKGQHIPKNKNTTNQTTSENHEHLHFVEYHLAGITPEGKTWLPDMEGCYFTAPVYLAGVDNGWPDAYGNSCHGPDCWMWETKFAEHPWLADKNYKGSMTFFPEETISFLIKNNQHNDNATGLVHIDTLNMKIRTAGAAILHPSNWDHLVSNWDSVRILSITDDYLQLAVLRDLFTEEKNNLLVFNYVSENYYQSWLATTQSKQTIRIDAQANYNFAQITKALAGTTGSSKTWVIDQDWPINWFNEMGQASAGKNPEEWNWAWDQQCVSDTRTTSITFSNRNGQLHYTLSQFNSQCHSMVKPVRDQTNSIAIESCSLFELSNSWLPTHAPVYRLWFSDIGSINNEGFWLSISTKANEFLAYRLVRKQ